MSFRHSVMQPALQDLLAFLHRPELQEWTHGIDAATVAGTVMAYHLSCHAQEGDAIEFRARDIYTGDPYPGYLMDIYMNLIDQETKEIRDNWSLTCSVEHDGFVRFWDNSDVSALQDVWFGPRGGDLEP